MTDQSDAWSEGSGTDQVIVVYERLRVRSWHLLSEPECEKLALDLRNRLFFLNLFVGGDVSVETALPSSAALHVGCLVLTGFFYQIKTLNLKNLSF